MEDNKIINEMHLSALPPTNALGDEFISELNKLSIKERDEVTYDVHGVSSVSEEDPDFIPESLDSFQSELKAIPVREKGAFLSALDQNRKYVTDKNFVLMFLRACQFDSKQAAARYVSYFQMKLELFGQDKLGRHIRVDDLDEDDITCLESGYAQVLNARDRADRAIFMMMPIIRKAKVVENKLRAIYMAFMFALQDVDSQKNGFVVIAYNVGRQKTKDRQTVFKTAKVISALPARLTGVHYCYDDETLRALFYIAMYAVQKASRLRARFHLGTDMEVIYNLMTFGIPSDSLPVGFGGNLRLDAHRDYVRRMRASDDLNDNIDRINVPSKYDVLLGRGKPLQKYSGNLNYHYVIEGYHDRYEAAAKGVKAELAMEIVKKIHSQGGRFLKQDKAGWTVITDEAARSKVSHTFRNHRIAARKKAVAKEKSTTNEGEFAPIDSMAKANSIAEEDEFAPIPFNGPYSVFDTRENIRFATPTFIENKKKKLREEF